MRNHSFRKIMSYFLAFSMILGTVPIQSFAEETSSYEENENTFFDNFSEEDWEEEQISYEEEPVYEKPDVPVIEEVVEEPQHIAEEEIPEQDVQEQEIQEEQETPSAPDIEEEPATISGEEYSEEIQEDPAEEIQVDENLYPEIEEKIPEYTLRDENGPVSIEVARKDGLAFPDGISVHLYSFNDLTINQNDEERASTYALYEDALLDAFMEEYGAKDRFDMVFDPEYFAGQEELISEHWFSYREEYRKALADHKIYAVSLYNQDGDLLSLSGYTYTITAMDGKAVNEIADGNLWIDFYTFDKNAKSSHIDADDYEAYYNKDAGSYFIVTDKINDETDGVFSLSLSDAYWTEPELSFEDILPETETQIQEESQSDDDLTMEDLIADDPEFYDDQYNGQEESEFVSEESDTEKIVIEEPSSEETVFEEPVFEEPFSEETIVMEDTESESFFEEQVETEGIWQETDIFEETQETVSENTEEFTTESFEEPETISLPETEYYSEETEISETLVTEYAEVQEPESASEDSFDEEAFRQAYIEEELLEDEDVFEEESIFEEDLSEEELFEEESFEEESVFEEELSEEELFEESSEEESEEDLFEEESEEESEEELFEESSKEELFEIETEDESDSDEEEIIDIEKELVEVEASPEEGLLAEKKLSLKTMAFLRGSSSAPSQEPVSGDGMTIEKITIKWLSTSSGESSPAGYGTLHLMPENEEAPNQQWQIDFALSGKENHEAGSIEIVMPAYIWKDRYGREPGVLTLAVPEDPENGADFAWKRVGDNIVFTNTHKLSAATKIMIQGTFRDMISYNMADIDTAAGSAWESDPYKGQSDKLFAVINVDTPNGSTISMSSNEIDATIDTQVSVTDATKTAFNPSTKSNYFYWTTVPSDIPSEFLPANPEDYCYVKWYISGTAAGSQTFDMTVTDTVSNEYNGIMLGIQGSADGNVKSLDNITASATVYSGYTDQPKTAYIWTAYPKSEFTDSNQRYTVTNTQTITVTGQDDLEESTMSAAAQCEFTTPVQYTVKKEWLDNNNIRGVRPVSLVMNVTKNGRNWKSFTLNDENNWTCAWTDNGEGAAYDVTEGPLGSGEYESYYDVTGVRHRLQWSYVMKTKTYDSAEHKWTFVNEYTEGWIKWDVSNMEKTTGSAFRYPNKRASSDRALNSLLHGTEAIVPYVVTTTAAIVPYTRNVLQHTADGQPVYVQDVDVELSDNRIEFNGVTLQEGDYDISYVQLIKPQVLDYWGYDDSTGYFQIRDASPVPDETLYMEINGNWVEAAVLSGDTITATNGASSESGYMVRLPDNVTRVKTVMRSGNSIVNLGYRLGVKVKPSQRVLEQIELLAAAEDYYVGSLDNFAAMKASELNGTEVIGMDDWSRGYLHGRVYRVAAWQKKSFKTVLNDNTNKRILLNTEAEMIQQSNVLTQSEYLQGVMLGDIPKTQSGTWYDLLPRGVDPDISTVKLQNGDKIKDVRLVENYMDSGRTLMIVEADFADHIKYNEESDFPEDSSYPVQGFRSVQKISFDCWVSWESARLYGIDNMRNVIAYEADEDEVGTLTGWKGEADDPAGGNNKTSLAQVGNDAGILTGLDNGRTDPSFVYAGANLVTREIDFAAETSVKKWVCAEGSGIWSNGQRGQAVVTEGGKYTYSVNLSSDEETTTSNIIFLDSLENFVPGSDSDDYGDAQWRGYFRSIDVSPLEEAGIAPVVYYSTVTGIDITGYNTGNTPGVIADVLANSGDWSTTLPADPADVTAIAVDCRKDTDGNDFELTEGKLLAYYINMRAPAKAAASSVWGAGKDAPANPDEVDFENPDHNAHAYNNIYLDATQVDGIGRETHAYFHWDYDKVGIVPFNLHVTKVWDDFEDNDLKRPSSATVHLLADGEDTGLFVTLNDDNEWKCVFEHLLKYDYDTTDPDYDGLDDGHQIRYTFAEDPIEFYEMSYNILGNEVSIINTHEPEKVSYPFEKTWEDDEENLSSRPSEITVKLMADGIFTGKSMTVKKDFEGRWTGVFTDIFRYDHGHEIVYSVEEERVDDYLPEYGQNYIVNRYYPYGDLVVTKELYNGTPQTANTEFTFTLTLKNDEGVELTDRYEYQIFNEEDTVMSTGQIGNGGEFKLKGGWRIEIKDIPSHSHYSVKEKKNPAYSTVIYRTVGEILTNAPADCRFANTYSSSGRYSIPATKKVNGRKLDKNQFKFDLYEVTNGGPITLLRSVANKEDGTVLFSSIRYTQDDDGQEKTYRIVERQENKAGYTYDTRSYIVKVTPHDDGEGHMICETHFYDENNQEVFETQSYVFPDRYEMTPAEYEALSGQEREDLRSIHQKPDFDPENDVEEDAVLVTRHEALFTNEYHASGDITLHAWKMMNGRTLAAGDFTFELLSSEKDPSGRNVVIQTKTNEADGSITWDPISFNESDIDKTIAFYVREVPGNDSGVIYDNYVYAYFVKVIDNGNGTLSFRQTHGNVKAVLNDNANITVRRYIYRYKHVPTEGDAEYYEFPASVRDRFRYYEESLTAGSPLLIASSPEDLETFEKAYVLSNLNGRVDTFTMTPVQIEAALKATFGVTDLQTNVVYIGSNEENPLNNLFDLAFNDDKADGTTDKLFLYKIDSTDSHYEPDGNTEDIPLFKNHIKPGSLSVTKLTEWEEGDEPDETQQFKFIVTIVNPDGSPIEGTFPYTPETVTNIGEISAGS